jgi:hypothetical protein
MTPGSHPRVSELTLDEMNAIVEEARKVGRQVCC